MKIIEKDFHRNGIGGEPFMVAIVEHGDDGDMLVVSFKKQGHTAAFSLAMLAEREIRFMHNSWRGDNFESELYDQLWDKE